MMKCKKCGEVKNCDDFYLTHRVTCKKCIRKQVIAWQKNNRKQVLKTQKTMRDRPEFRKKQAEYYRKWYEAKGRGKRSQRQLKQIKSWQKLHPESCRAGSLVQYAVETGKITRPKACVTCKEKRKLLAHHDDYNFPLNVKWLCYSCHQKLHNGIYLALQAQ